MTVRAVRFLFAAFLGAFAFAVAGPGMVPFNRIHPLVLGLPLSMAWIVLWVVLSGVALFLLDRSESRERDENGGE
jgi:hypothetical protein